MRVKKNPQDAGCGLGVGDNDGFAEDFFGMAVSALEIVNFWGASSLLGASEVANMAELVENGMAMTNVVEA